MGGQHGACHAKPAAGTLSQSHLPPLFYSPECFQSCNAVEFFVEVRLKSISRLYTLRLKLATPLTDQL